MERGQDREGGLDRVDALSRFADVGGRTGDVDVEPEDADLGDGDRAGKRLGDERGIRAEGSGDGREDALERAVARALLLDDRLQLHRSGWRKAEAA